MLQTAWSRDFWPNIKFSRQTLSTQREICPILVRGVVVAQVVERSLPTPQIRGLSPNIGKVLSTNCNEIETTKIKTERPERPIFKNVLFWVTVKGTEK